MQGQSMWWSVIAESLRNAVLNIKCHFVVNTVLHAWEVGAAHLPSYGK
jgi:hypothetical protein